VSERRSTRPPHGEVDVVIVGAGVAALAAALAAREAGASVRLVGGPRGLSHLASGVWDRGDLTRVPAPLRAALASARRDAERAVLRALGGYRAIPFRAGDRPLVATAEGTLRRVLTAERNVLDLAPLADARVAVVGIPTLPHADPRALARSLDEDSVRRGDQRRFFAVELEHGRRAHDVLLGGPELARAHDVPRARDRLATAIARAIAELPCQAVLLPPILGSSGDGVTSHLERALGRPVGELVQGRSIQSERVVQRLEVALDALDPARLRADAESLSISDLHVELRAARTRVHARAAVLCTGRELAGGLAGGRATLLDLEAPDGLAVDAGGRVLVRGAPAARVFAGGTVTRGLDPARGVGLGLVAASGWLAGRGAALRARA
jgi:anaerobic glycerol-3-phosphate dehydrogenase